MVHGHGEIQGRCPATEIETRFEVSTGAGQH